MKAATLHNIKKQLQHLEKEEIINICLRLGRFKKDNKELLTYVIFESGDEASYIRDIKILLEEQFDVINFSNVYYLKKNLRKILRGLDKFIRYSGNKETESTLRLHFCRLIQKYKIPMKRSKVLRNLYDRQIDKIKKSIATLHEDLQYDYEQELQQLLAI